MKKNLLIIVLCFTLTSLIAQQNTPNPKWMTTDGPVNAIVKDGNTIYLGGSFNGAGYGAPGIAKFSPLTSAVPYANIKGLTVSTVQAIVSDGGTGWYIGGGFTAIINGVTYYNVARLKSDFTLDTTFKCSTNSTVYALALKGNVLYIGGSFTYVNNTDNRNYLAAVNKNTGTSLAWNPGADSYVNGLGYKDSLILATGSFTNIGGKAEKGFAAISEVTGLPKGNYDNIEGTGFDLLVKGTKAYVGGSFYQTGDYTGSLVKFAGTSTTRDFNFPESNGIVFCVLADGSGGWYVGGSFTNISNSGKNYLAHILANGTVDPVFDAGLDHYPLSLHLNNGKLYIGGYFQYVNNNAVMRSFIASVDPTTGLATNWDPGADNLVYSITSKDSLIFICGGFSYVNGKKSTGLACISRTTGLLKTSFELSLNSASGSSVLADGNHLYVNGSFSGIGMETKYLAKATTTNDKPDINFPSTDGTISCVVSDGSGGYYVGGSFQTIGGINQPNLAHILSNGTIDATFVPQLNGNVNTIAVGSGGVFAGGNFSTVNSVYTGFFTKVDFTGALASGFNGPVCNSYVHSIAFKGTTVYVGGAFTSVDTNSTAVTRNYAFAANATTGKLLNWNPNLNSYINKIITNASGSKVYLGGSFTTVNGSSRNYVASVNTTSGAVQAWNVTPNSIVQDLLLDGNQIYLAGWFTTVNGSNRSYIAAVDTSNAATLSAFNAGVIDNLIISITKAGTNLYLGGAFTNVNGSTRNYAAAVNITSGALQSWNPNPNSQVNSIVNYNTDILFGGLFTHTKYVTRYFAARIDISTATVNSWDPQVDGPVYAVEKKGNKVFLAGAFNNVQSQPRTGLCAIDSATAVLQSFDAGLNSAAYGIKIAGTNIYAQGPFTSTANGTTSRNYAAAFNLTTGATTAWNPSLNVAPSYTLTPIGFDGTNLVIGGTFTMLAAKSHSHFAAIDLISGKATSLTMDCDNLVYGITSYGNKIYVAGHFTNVDGSARNHAFAFDDPSSALLPFNPDANIIVSYLDNAYQIGSKVYLGGTFTSTVSDNIVSVDTLGNLITNWAPKANSNVHRFIGDSTQLIPVGSFYYFDYRNSPNLIALDATTGKVNSNFKAYTNNTVYGLTLLGNTIYAGGSFSTAKDTAREFLAAFNKTTGSLQSWAPVPNASVNKLKNDGTNIYAVGNFTLIGATNRGYGASFTTGGALNTWNPQANNYINDLWISGSTVYLGGAFTALKNTQPRQYAGAISTTNTLTSFNPTPDSYVNAITGNANHLYLGGSFSNIAGQPRSSVASFNLASGSLRSWHVAANPTGNQINAMALAGNKIYIAGYINDSIGLSTQYDLALALDTVNGVPNAFHPVNTPGYYAYSIQPTCNDVLLGGYLTNTYQYQFLSAYDNTITINRNITQPTCTYSTNGAISLNLSYGYLPYSSYAWSNGATTQNVNNLTVGTYTVTVTDAEGCTNTRSNVLTNANPDPVATITPAGTITICSGQSATLTAATNTSYLWNTGATTQSINVSTAGNYKVTVTGAGGCTKVSATKNVVVNAVPVITISPSPVAICKDDSLQLFASGASSSYVWLPTTYLSAASIANPYCKPTANVTYTVTGTNTNGCSATASVSVTANTKPNVTVTPSNGTVCPGNSVVFNAAGSSVSYAWSPATGLNQTTTSSVSAGPVVTTTYTVTGSSAAGCTATKTAKVTVSNPKPVNLITSSISASGATLKWDTVSCAIGYKVQYKLHSAANYTSVNINTNNPQRVLSGLLANSAYDWRVKAKYPNASYSGNSVLVTFTTLVVRETDNLYRETLNDLILYPNPATDKITVEFPFTGDRAVIKVFNTTGQMVMEHNASSEDESISLNVSNLSPGLYVIYAVDAARVFSSRFLKK